MNLQKLHSFRVGNPRVVQRYLEKIDEAKSILTLMHFNVSFEALECTANLLNLFTEKVLNQADFDGIGDEIIKKKEYTLDLNIKLRD